MTATTAGVVAATVPASDYATLLWLVLGGGVALAVLHLTVVRLTGGAGPRHRRGGRFGGLLAAATVLAALLLGLTAGIGLELHAAVVGWPLFGHVVVGGVFLFLLALFAVWRSAPGRPGRGRGGYGVLARVGFWLMLVTGLVAGATMLLSTFPVFGAERLEALLDLHRWSGLALVGAAVAHAHGLLLGRIGRARDDTAGSGSALASTRARPTSPA